ncbi:MAG: hypothetical protein ACOCVS_01855 [Planctomycetota bacterium]
MTHSPLRLPLLCLLAAGFAGRLDAADMKPGSKYNVRIMPAAWLAVTRGDVGFLNENSSASLDQEIEQLEDMDLDNAEVAPMLEIGVNPPFLVDLYAGVFLFGSDSNFELGEDLEWGSSDFGGGTDLSADVEFMDAYIELGGRPFDFDFAGLSVGAALHGFTNEVTLSAGSDTDTLDEFALVPVLAVRAWVTPPMLNSLTFEGKIHWMSIDAFDVEAEVLDAAAQVTWRPLPSLGVMGGYRILDYDLDYDLGNDARAKLDLTLGGPYLGAVIQF